MTVQSNSEQGVWEGSETRMSSDSEIISSGKAIPRRRVVVVGEFEVMRIGITPGRSFCKRTKGGSWIFKSLLRRKIADAS